MTFQHIVYVVEREGRNYIRIDRKFIDGKTRFFTELEMPNSNESAPQTDQFARLASQLGATLCIDSQDIRQILDKEEK